MSQIPGSDEQRAKARASRQAWLAANRGQVNARKRAWRTANRQKVAAWERMKRHGRDIFTWLAVTWDEQGGKCYLCETNLDPENSHIDHDHRCCRPNRSCPICRRGLACRSCNHLIGLARDDPALLRLVAGKLEVKLAIITARLAEAPRQLTLDDVT